MQALTNKIINIKNIFFLVLFILISLTILLTLYSYDVSNNGYKIVYSNTVELSNSNYESVIENDKISLNSFDVVEQKIIIDENDPEYIFLFFNLIVMMHVKCIIIFKY